MIEDPTNCMGIINLSTNHPGTIMQRFFAFLLAIALLLSLTACGSKYVVTTKSGEKYMANGPLDLDVKDKTYTVIDEDGNPVILEQDDIDKVTEQKD